MKVTEQQLNEILNKDGYKEIDYSSNAIVPNVGKPKQNKYGARKTEVDGIMFDSAAEAKRYSTLKLLESAGEISDLVLQPSFNLQRGFVFNGKRYRPISYRADFKYVKKDGTTVVEDVKGVKTADFAIKWKLLLHTAIDYGSPIEFNLIVGGK